MQSILEDREHFAREATRVQRERAHIFHTKLRRRARAGGARPSYDAAEMSVTTFASVHSAADFALTSGLPLDVLVTIDLNRLGAQTHADAQKEVTRFLKCYHAWAESKKLPVAWIYAIEVAATAVGTGCHAHIALFVPGHPIEDTWTAPMPVNFRRQFKDWARQYTLRQFGRHIPRAIVTRGASRESVFRHWMAVSYLLKGYERSAIVQSARSSPDGRPVYLGDLIPWPYCNPGRVDLSSRIRVSHSLGPARRNIGVPTGMEFLLPTRPNWDVIQISRMTPLTLMERLETRWTIPVPRPFRSLWEDGVRDVRLLYPADFYEYVTRQPPYEDAIPYHSVIPSTGCQLNEMAE